MPDPHITIPDEDPIIQYTVGGTPDDEFTFPFSFFATTDIKVYDGADLIDAADYTVTGTAGTSGGFDGGTVLLDTPVSDTVITILRDVPAARTTDFPLSGPFNIESLNTQLDKNFAILQQQNRLIERRVGIPDTDASDLDMTLPAEATRATKVFAFDADGEPVVSTQTLAQIEAGSTTAQDWATKTNGAVSGGEYSAKAYAIGGTGITDTAGKGAAKEWATAAEDDTVDGTEYSAKHYSIKASASASSASTSASTATTQANAAGVSAAAALASEQAAAASAASGMYDAIQNIAISGDIELDDEGDLFRVDTSGGNITLTLDAITTLGDFKVAVAKITGDANTVTISTTGADTINGGASYTLDAQYENVTLISKSGTTDFLAIGGGASTSGYTNPDYFTGDGAEDEFTLSRDPGSENTILVIVGGVPQLLNTFSVSGTTLTFSAAPGNGVDIEVRYLAGSALDIGVPSDASVTTAKIADLNVTAGKLAASLDLTAQTITNVNIDSGAIDGTIIGANSAAAATVTTLTATGAAEYSGNTWRLQGNSPTMRLQENDQASDEKVWSFGVTGGNFNIRPQLDNLANGSTIGLSISRGTGATMDNMSFALDSGSFLFTGGPIDATVAGATVAIFDRTSNDGNIVEFQQAGTTEGQVSVAGTTLTYATFCGAHIGQLNDKSVIDILPGTIMETIDEMCSWRELRFKIERETKEGLKEEEIREVYYGDKPDGSIVAHSFEGKAVKAKVVYLENQTLAKVKISDTPGSKSVYGSFMRWYEESSANDLGDMNVASLGTWMIRMEPGSSVKRGDLIESAGNGCGRVQADDAIRSSTVGKITSGTVQKIYDDGSYLVPCVFYCG